MPQPTSEEPTTITHAKQISYVQALPPSNYYHPAPVQSPNKINKKVIDILNHAIYQISSASNFKDTFLLAISAIMVEQLKILYWNCQGLGNKKFELLQFIQQHKIHIILLNETHLKPTTLLKLPNYHTYRNDRPTPPGQSGAGGTAILIANKIVHYAVPIQTNALENPTIHIQINNQVSMQNSISEIIERGRCVTSGNGSFRIFQTSRI
ncbi:hypothetical protein QTP88_005533 [Uroleucon formosanum]